MRPFLFVGTSNCVNLHAGGVVELFKMRGRIAIYCAFKSSLPCQCTNILIFRGALVQKVSHRADVIEE